MADDKTINLNVKFNKGGADQALTDISNKIIAVKNKQEELNKSFDEGTITQQEYTKATKANQQEMAGLVKEQTQVIKSTTDLDSAQESLRKRMRDMTVQLQQMQVEGKGNTAEFWELAKAAGALKDDMGDATAAIKYFSSDTRRLDVAVSGLKGVAAAASIAEGAMSALGIENEDFQKQLIKLQGLQTMMAGLKDFNGFLKEGTFRIGVMSAAQKAYSIVVGTSTGALKVFKLALAATGIGAIIIAVGLLIANWEKINALWNKSGENAKALASDYEVLTAQMERQNEVAANQLKYLEAIGTKASEVTKKKISLNQEEEKTQEALIANLDEQMANATKLSKINELDAERQKAYQKLYEIQDARTLLRIQLTKDEATEADAANKKKLEGIEKLKDAERQYQEYKQERIALGIKDEEERARYELSIEYEKQKASVKALEVNEEIKSKMLQELALINAAKLAEIDEISQQKRVKSRQELIAKIRAEDNRSMELDSQLKDETRKQQFDRELNDWYMLEDEKNQAATKYDELDIGREKLRLKLNELYIKKQQAYQLEQEDIFAEIEAERDQEAYDSKLVTDEERAQIELDLWYENQEKKINAELDQGALRDQALLDLKASYNNQEKDLLNAQAETHKQIEAAKANATMDGIASVASMVSEALGKETAAGKAAAIISVTIRTIKGAIDAFTGFMETPGGPIGAILGAVAAAATVAMGVKSISEINSTPTSVPSAKVSKRHSGGFAPNEGMTILKKGEYVVNDMAMKSPEVAQSIIEANNLALAGGVANTQTNKQTPVIIQNTIALDDIREADKKQNKIDAMVTV
jgi:hypothetical protein